ncbi:hypothetical protein HXX76_007428 [Chlamydomonas incerta]|uniref:DNA polymerase kappa n=1 Tax=Chlamydomonas incerta TaxID=51695 RepID=A0A835W128_CHLIN|nr:hypothetical protein HXX76_007428 [Chlamydomonas incerta]|eukprot:KAG2435355.1 hypothetical protein HXX76_007428 [Chlamydomonas incerta]
MADTHISGLESLETAGNGGSAMPAARRPGQSLSPVQPQPESASDPAWKDYQTVFTNAKAGMDGVDKARVQQIVWEMSKDSAHFKNEQRKQASVLERIERMKLQAAAITPAELAAAGRFLDARIAGCEARRDLTRTWLHVDMDCFYAAVHEREQPELKRLPVAVGGMGMICTANYVARRFGVRSAMPGFIGKRLCPKLVFIKPDFAKYTAAAEVVRGAFRQLDPDFESGGLDEAFLDVTDYCTRTSRSGEEAATELRRLVKEVSGGLTCSVGVAANKMLAKICSDINKPDGQYVLPPSRAAIMSFMDTLPVRKIPCIGKVTEQVLQGVLAVSTCGQLLAPDSRCRLPLLFSEVAAGFFLEAALGLAATRHGPKTDTSVDPGRKGISHERTFRNMSAPAELEAMAKQLVEALVADMGEEDIEGRNITLKLKLSTFEVRTRASTLPRHARTVVDILPAVLRLLRAELPVTIRLMGVRMAMLRKVNAGAKSPLARLLGLRHTAQRTDGQQGAAGTTSPPPLCGGSAPPACAAKATSGPQAAGAAASHGEVWANAVAYGGGAGLWDAFEVQQERLEAEAEDAELEEALSAEQEQADDDWPQQHDDYGGAEADEEEAICILDSDDEEWPAHAGPTGAHDQPRAGQQPEEQDARGGGAARKRTGDPATTGAAGPAAGPGHKRPRCQDTDSALEAGVGAAAGAGPGAGGATATQPVVTAAAWTCQVCTYARNRRQFLRCEVCDARKGMRPSTAAPHPAEQQAGLHGRRQQVRTNAAEAVGDRAQHPSLLALLKPPAKRAVQVPPDTWRA